MREVVIAGIGQTPVREHWDLSLREIAGQAAQSALIDAGRESVSALFVSNMLSGILNKQENLGGLLADWLGFKEIDAIKIESACASGAAAIHAATLSVASGLVDNALVVGVEKMTETLPIETASALATAADSEYEISHGLSFVSINALIMKRYLYQYNWSRSDLANFSIIAHENALHNPNARLRESINLKSYLSARIIADPISILDASPIGDGAAAVFITSLDNYPLRNKKYIKITGSASATDTIAVHDRRNPLWLKAAEKSTKKALSQAGVTNTDIDFFELHDAFSIMAALSIESCGFAEQGQAPKLLNDGAFMLDGKLPISTFGGLKARGHPVGATGIYQAVEAVLQLRGEANKNQIEGAQIGMVQNIGGSGATIITHIFRPM